MSKLLFSSEGQIGRSEFQKGAVILLAVNFFLWPVWYISLGLGAMATIGSFVLIYCWACLFVKRLRSAGKPGIWFVPIFLLFAVLSYFLGNIFLTILSPEIVPEILEFQEIADPQNPDMEYILPFYERLFKALAIPYAASYLIVGAAIAFLANKNLPSNSP